MYRYLSTFLAARIVKRVSSMRCKVAQIDLNVRTLERLLGMHDRAFGLERTLRHWYQRPRMTNRYDTRVMIIAIVTKSVPAM